MQIQQQPPNDYADYIEIKEVHEAMAADSDCKDSPLQNRAGQATTNTP